MWLLAAIVLGIAELIVPGVFLIWLAAAAAITGLVALAFGIPLPFQFAVFALVSIAAVYLGRRWYLNNPHPSADPLLNDRAARLTGRTVLVVQAIVNGEGRVKVGDGVWSCRGPDCAEGARVRITGADGSCLKVEPVLEIEGPASS
ncbi:MAG TPA: NfeD family protein [Allosphingosinicella sp.]|nr:NfeD family protein [Allosphingosinicella sp.]